MLISGSHLIFDWGDTIMKDDVSRSEAMHLWPSVEAVAGAKDVLAVLSKTHHVVIATSAASTAEWVRLALKRVELDHYFRDVFSAKTTGFKKTEPGFWLHILHALQVKPEAVTMVGDSFENDVVTPVALGMQAIWLNERTDESRSGERYRTIHALRELV